MPSSAALPVSLYQLMFVYSGVNKLHHFDKKVDVLAQKVRDRTSLSPPREVAQAGMVGAIVLEVVGSLFLVYVALARPKGEVWRRCTAGVVLAFVVFVVLATLLYHFPDGKGRLIPALSNLTTATGFLFMWQAVFA